MEICGILQFLKNRSILITGATGFLAKVLIEKILRVQPQVKKLFLLLRAADSVAALHRFNSQVLGKELFGVLKEKYGENFDGFIKEKISVVCGDITLANLGLQSSTMEELYDQLHVVINLAATTDFDERYDVSLRINTFGPANVLNFSKKCSKLEVFLQVSTAYVCGERGGSILETPFNMGDALNGTSGLDIDIENEIVEEALAQLRGKNAHDKHIAATMKALGHQRAKRYGWPNTYSFTKAMGEMVLGHLKEESPLVIIRPTIVTSTFKEPFPGWLEGVRNIDSFIVGYGKGKMACFPGDPQSIVDLIPVDMVANAMIAAMATHARETTGTVIYNVGSSMSNPVMYRWLQHYGFIFFTEQPWCDKNGNPVLVNKGKELPTMYAVRMHLAMHYMMPLKIMGLVNTLSCKYFQESYLDLSRKVELFMRLVKLFSPYVFFKGVFDDTNTENLRRGSRDENEMFYFDPKMIDWEDYFMYTHIAGVVKHAFHRR